MRKLYLLICAFCLSTASFAQYISFEEAEMKAEEFFNVSKTKSSGGILELIYGVPTKTSGSSELYIFNRKGGGFVIINGSGTGTSILGYSLTNHFKVNGMPESMKGWFDYLKSSGNHPASEYSTTFTSEEAQPVVFLNTAEWDQWAPFNNLCPVIDGNAAPTGCIQTAAAILMQYYGWPAQGKGRTEDYHDSWSNVDREGYELTTVYDWERLQKIHTVEDAMNADVEVQQNLAQLHKDLGAIMKAQYSPGGTCANCPEDKLVEYMGYKAAPSKSMECFAYADWMTYLKGFLDNDQPVFAGGGGHQYIVDGYDNHNYFHFNYGWGGNCNGYYFIDGEGYTMGMQATGNIVPNYDGEEENMNGFIYLTAGYDVVNSPHGIEVYPDWGQIDVDIKTGIKYYFDMGEIDNFSGISYEGNIKMVLEDKDGNIKQDNIQIINGEEQPYHLSMTGFSGDMLYHQELMISNSVNLELGDKIVAYHTRSDNQWEELPSYKDDATVSERAVIPCFFIRTVDSYNVGDQFECRLVNGWRPYGASFAWSDESIRAYSKWEILDKDGNTVFSYRNDERENWMLGKYYTFSSPGNYTINVTVFNKVHGHDYVLPEDEQVDFISTTITVQTDSNVDPGGNEDVGFENW